MERYTIITQVGVGSFGNVWRAINKQTGEIVAIKKMKQNYNSWEDCINLREVKSLRTMDHPNIVKLREVVKEHDTLYFVFEYMDSNLYQLMENRRGRPFSETEVRNWCFQIFHALAHVHLQKGCFHRDMKPENLLVTGDTIKIADFGLAREISSKPPYTEYVSTRWYRAPEIILGSPHYGAAVDMWAMGAIMAELFTLRPLFPGMNESDQMYKICSVIGTPNQVSWAEGLQLAEGMSFCFPQLDGVQLSVLIPSASASAIDLIRRLCSWDPSSRPTAVEALQHPFFSRSGPCLYIPPSLRPEGSRIPSTRPSGCVLDQNYRNHPTGLCSRSMKHVNSLSSPNVDHLQNIALSSPNVITKSVESFCGNQNRDTPAAVRNSLGCFHYPVDNAQNVLETVEKISKMTLGPGLQPAGTRRLPPPPGFEARGWHSQWSNGVPASKAIR